MIGLGKLAHGWEPSREWLLEPLKSPRFQIIKLERFPRGIDNAHVDVALDQEMVGATDALVSDLLRDHVDRLFAQRPPRNTEPESADSFRERYRMLMRAVVEQARSVSRPELVQLLQLALLKHSLSAVDRELTGLRNGLDDRLVSYRTRDPGEELVLHERKVLLARWARSLRYRILRDLCRVISRVDAVNLRKFRKSVLGTSWPVSPDLFDSAFVLLGGEGGLDDFLLHFPMLLREPAAAHQLNLLVFQLCEAWLPDGVGVPAQFASVGDLRLRRDQGGLKGFIDVELRLSQMVLPSELELGLPHAFDDPSLVLQLLSESASEQAPKWTDRRMSGLRKRLQHRFEKMLVRAKLFDQVIASFLLSEIYPQLGLQDSAEPIYDYLAGRIRRRDLLRRLNKLPEDTDIEGLVKRIDSAVRQIKPRDAHTKSIVLAQCAAACMRFRYQLKLAWWIYRGMDGLRLLNGWHEHETSAANHLLQRLTWKTDRADARVKASGHVVIKADVRGSTEITAKMREQNLNPAVYFSRNLYEPINKLLREYGAEKVFVEGDAVILAIMEEPSQDRQHLAIALACSLAQRILKTLEAKNAESKRLGLPMLELGLGIAYSNEEPTYLYDGDHRIMISPAINRADRLSSCNGRLRTLHRELGDQLTGIDVVAKPVAEEGQEAEVMRFNVNGIELDAPAYFRLVGKLVMRRLQLPDHYGDFLIGRYPDRKGMISWLVLREAPVRSWVDEQLKPNGSQSQRFYEVISDEKLINELRRRVKRRPASRADSATLGPLA